MKHTLILFVFFFFMGLQSLYASYGDCGLGTTVIKSKGAIQQSFAYTTNATSHTFSVTTKTSGCDFSGIVFKKQLIKSYVLENLATLQEEMIQGEGPYTQQLTALYDCQASAVQFTQSIKPTILNSLDKTISKEAQVDWVIGEIQKTISQSSLSNICKVS